MALKLPRESFVALAAVAWADGWMVPHEAKGLAHAARSSGLSNDDVATVETATKTKVGLDAFDASKLSTRERLLTYGLASWLARVDGIAQSDEIESLRALAKKLESPDVTDHRLRAAAAVAFDVAMLPEGRRPEKYDFAGFASRLAERFPDLE